MPTPITGGVVNIGDVAMQVSDNAPAVYEGIGGSGKAIFRLDSDASLVLPSAPTAFRMPTPAEIVTRNTAITLAAAQAANDAAAAALTAAGGEPCPA